MSTISVKLHVAKEVRRFAIARNISLAAFHHFVCEKLVPTLKEYENHLHYVYVDDEQDTVKILLEEEWREALNVAAANDGYITLKITRHGAPAKAQEQEQPQARFAYACPRFARCQQAQQQAQQPQCPRYAQFFGCPRFAQQQQQACPKQQYQQQAQAQQGNPWSNMFQTVLKDICKQQEHADNKEQSEENVAFDLESILNQVFGKQQQEQAKQQPQQTKKQETPAPATTTTTSVPVQQVIVDAAPIVNTQHEEQQAPKQQEQVATEEIVIDEPVAVAVENKPAAVEQVPIVQQPQVVEQQQQPDYQLELNALQSMGFTNTKFNLHLLNHNNGNMAKVIDTLLTIKLE